jgi:hypothetical protein
MSRVGITFGSGISIGRGVSIGGTGGGSFTIGPSDFAYNGFGQFVTPNGTSGFTITNSSGVGPGWAYYGLALGSSKQTELENFWTANSLSQGNAYMFDVSWGAGSTQSSGVVIMQFFSGGNILELGVVDTGIAGWNTPGTSYYNGPILTLTGTWNFPATFTLITPVIQDSSEWC